MPLHPSLLHFLELSQGLARFSFLPKNSCVAGIRRTGMLTGLAQISECQEFLRGTPLGGCVFVGKARVAQSVFQADFFLQERLHLDWIFAARGFEFALNVV